MKDATNTTHEEKHDLLPEDGPPEDVYWKAVPIWTGQSHDDLAEGFGGEYEKVVRKWPIGSVRPFGTAGIVLGALDRAGK